MNLQRGLNQDDGEADHHNHVGMLLPKDLRDVADEDEENGGKEGCEHVVHKEVGAK